MGVLFELTIGDQLPQYEADFWISNIDDLDVLGC